jgi:hypothetical protein
VSFEGRERRKIFVAATLTSPATGAELALGSGTAIAAEARNLEARGLT